MCNRHLDFRRIHKDVATLRLSMGYSERQLAKRLGISPSTFTRLSKGEACYADTLAAILTWLGTTDLAPYLKEQHELDQAEAL